MPQTPEDLSRIIREMAERHAKDAGKRLHADGAFRISQIPPNYSAMRTIPVDLDKLERMVGDVIAFAPARSDNVIGKPEIEEALKKVNCHYLWFC